MANPARFRPLDPTRLTGIVGWLPLAAAALMLPGQPVQAQEIKPIYYVSFKQIDVEDPAIKVNHPNILMENRELEEASAVVVRAQEMSDYQERQLNTLRDFVLRAGGPAVFAIRDAAAADFELAPDFLETRLGIERATNVNRAEGDQQSLVVAQGLYRIASDPPTPVDGVIFRAPKVLEVKEILDHIRDFVISTIYAKAQPVPLQWVPKPAQSDVFLCSPYGKFRQTVTPYILQNGGGGGADDLWYIKVENASTPGANCRSIMNQVTCRLNSANNLLNHGPQGTVPQNVPAVVRIQSGPAVTWGWNTRATEVIDQTQPAANAAGWQVTYDPMGAQSQRTFVWLPGAEAANPRNQSFSVTCDNELVWLDDNGQHVPCRATWSFVTKP